MSAKHGRAKRRPDPLIHERTYLSYQRELREGGTHVLNEAMLTLDIIDVKTQSLLSYISISLAALIFLLTAPATLSLVFTTFSHREFHAFLLVIIVLLLLASLLCLSCLHIVGAHTIAGLALQGKPTMDAYELLVLRVTSARRHRYLIAHRLSIGSALLTTVIFIALLIGALF